MNTPALKSLDEVYTDHSLLFQDVTPSPEEATHQSQLRTMLRKAISKLPEREALVLQLYYVEELNVYEVAAILDVTTGRVSQIKRAAIERAHSLIMENGLKVTTTPYRARSQQPACDLLPLVFYKSTSHAF